MHDLSLFNSHPHKEDDVYVKGDISCISFSTHILTRRMTKPSTVNVRNIIFSTHILTRRMTQRRDHYVYGRCIFNSHPHKEDDFCMASVDYKNSFSTHILTRRMTAILNKNTLSKTARIIPFEYNTLKIYIFSNSYLLFFWKSTPFSGANLQEDFCALIIRTKISKYP